METTEETWFSSNSQDVLVGSVLNSKPRLKWFLEITLDVAAKAAAEDEDKRLPDEDDLRVFSVARLCLPGGGGEGVKHRCRSHLGWILSMEVPSRNHLSGLCKHQLETS